VSRTCAGLDEIVGVFRARTLTSHRSTSSTSLDFDDAADPIDPFDHDPAQVRQQDTKACKITWRPSSCRPISLIGNTRTTHHGGARTPIFLDGVSAVRSCGYGGGVLSATRGSEWTMARVPTR
jgi:hypothetical protein